MMSNLFSMFDTNTNTLMDLNFLSSLLILLMFPNLFWLLPTKFNILHQKIYILLNQEFKLILMNKFNYLNMILLTSLFFMIYLNNTMGMFPYIFTSSSHLVFSLSLSIPIWISLMLLGWFKNTNFMFSHLIPQNTPIPLMPFMVLIESTSNIIRPLTLSIRLTANMIAGHLLLTLLSQTAETSMYYTSIFIIISQILLLTLEFSVSMIQSYVFAILITLYLKETN